MNEVLPWEGREETAGVLTVVHRHRWLGCLGWPWAVVGAAGVCALWVLPLDGGDEVFPFRVVGTLIGAAFVLFGLHLSLHRVEITADQSSGALVRRDGMGVLSRTRRYALAEVTEVRCEAETTARYSGSTRGPRFAVLLIAPTFRVHIASFIEPEPIRLEAARWARFLGRPLVDRMEATREGALRHGLGRRG